MDEAAIRDALIEHWRKAGIDEDASHEVYHDDAVLEFPQSGERFVGKANFLSWRRQYPASLDFHVRRLAHDGDLWIAENLISYDGGPWLFTVSIMTFRASRIAHERIYITEGFEAAPWREPWVERFDPHEALTTADWRAGTS